MIRKKNPNQKRVIDISGPAGSVYNLLSVAHEYTSHLGLDWEKIKTEMKSSDYENLLKVFDKYFGKFCDLER